MQKPRGFKLPAVVFGDFCGKVRNVVYTHRHYPVKPGRLGRRIERSPESSEGLGQDGGAVIISGFPAGMVGNHQKDRRFTRVFRLGELGREFIKPCQHHFHAGLYRQRAGFKVYNPVEQFWLVGGYYFVGYCVVLPVKPVDALNQPALAEPGDIPARVVVRGVGNAQPAGVVN